MTVTALKRRVTRFFKSRKLVLQKIDRDPVRADDDFFELFVLYCFVSRAPRTRAKATSGKYFRVATSPSAHWGNASYFEFVSGKGHRIGLRTGLQVLDPNGRKAELDMLAVRLPASREPSTIASTQVEAAAECKLLSKKASVSVADHVLGKAYRVWGLPVTPIGTVPRFVVVHLGGISEGARQVLADHQVGELDARQNRSPVPAHASAVIGAL